MTNFDIGTDIVSLSRIRLAIERHGNTFIKRIFTPEEIALAKCLKDPSSFYAGRFAAKEAISKAFGTGIGSLLSWQDIEILKDESGKPKAHLSKKSTATFNFPIIKISISHEKENAIAFAVCYTQSENGSV